MMTRFLSLLVVSILLASCGAAGAKDSGHLPVAQACFVTETARHPVVLEVASDSKDRQKGLMGREALAENAGMLFIYGYERSPEQGFWMYQTLLPLDIAFLDNEGVIVSIRQMHPCASSRSNDCPSYPAGVSYWRAVEMNAGYFNSRQIEAGDRLVRDQPAFCNR